MAGGYDDPVPGAKAALKRSEPLAKVAAETRNLRNPQPAAAPTMGRKMARKDHQPKSMRSNVAMRRSLMGGR